MSSEDTPQSDERGDADDTNDVSYGSEPLPNRIDRETLGGCLGIVCILALLGLLWFASDLGRLPIWISALLPTLSIALGVCGLILVARVPAGSAPRSYNPLRPLTREGAPPLLERPARLANRISLLVALLLGAVILGGYALLIAAPIPGHGLLYGPLITAAASLTLTVAGIAVVLRRLPQPAWTWERRPTSGPLTRQGGLLALFGAVPLLGSLLTAMLAGYRWAPLTFSLLLLAGIFSLPFMRRSPRRSLDTERLPDIPFGAESSGTPRDAQDAGDDA